MSNDFLVQPQEHETANFTKSSNFWFTVAFPASSLVGTPPARY